MSGAKEDTQQTEAPEPESAETASKAPEARRKEAGPGALDFVIDVPLRLTVEIGSARMRVAELLQVDKGSVIELDRLAGEPADLLVNGRFVARAEVTVVEERLAVRVLEIEGRGVRED